MEKKEENGNKENNTQEINQINNDNNTQENNQANNQEEGDNNNDNKDTKKSKGINFFNKIKSKINNFTASIDKKISNMKKEKTDKEEKNNENIETKDEKNENNIDMELGEKNDLNKLNNDASSIKLEEQNPLEQVSISPSSYTEEKLEEKEEEKTEDKKEIKKEETEEEENEKLEEKEGEKIDEIIEGKTEKKKQYFSKDELKKLYFAFHTILIENKKYDKFLPEITNILESLIEYLINGDKNDPSILEIFQSIKFLDDIIMFLSKKNKDINIQIIKFFSVLMTNLSEKNFVIFLINCDYINQAIYEDTEVIDGDYLYYYINFVKSLLFKINTFNIRFFFHEDTNTFPLLVNCLKFYNHPDSMISNTIRNIFLFVLKMGYQPCIDYICNLPMISYFVFISCTLRDEIKTLDKKINRSRSKSSTILHERICNDILYFQDIFSINNSKINYILINSIFHFLILPTLCNSLVVKHEADNKNNQVDNNTGNKLSVFNFIKEISNDDNDLLKDCISKELALYIFNLFFRYIKNETFLNALLSILFLPKIHYKIMEKIKRPVKNLYNYKGDYDTKSKNKMNLEKSITENYTIPYMCGLISNPNKKFNDLIKIDKKLEEKCKNSNIEKNLNLAIPYGFYMELINDYFSRGALKDCREYHQIISEATGIQCGLTYHEDRKSVLYLLNKNLKNIKNDFSFEKNENKFVNNLININFMDEFKQCKYLYLLLMYNYLFNQILKNEFVSKELLAHIELLNPQLIHKNQNSNLGEEDSPILQVNDLIKSQELQKVKTTKIKIITFSNLYKVMYNKDFFLTEFNLYDNSILAKYFYNGQVEYNSTIVGVILNYLNRDDLLRPEIYLFLIKLINDLIVYEENDKKYLLKLRENQASIIKNIFIKHIEKIIKLISSDKIEIDDLIKVFEFVFDKNQEKINTFEEYDNIINDFMEDCLFLLNKKTDEKNKAYGEKLQLYNSIDIKSLELKIRIYFIKLFFDIYDGVCEGKYKSVQIEDIKDIKNDLNEENRNKIKERIMNNFYKLTIKEFNVEFKDD